MQSPEWNYPAHEQELLAVIHALRTWRYYLDGTKFIVNTDHATLRHFPTQFKLTRRQARWMELLQEYYFDFKYKRGVDPTLSPADQTTANLTPLSCTTSVSPCLPTSAISLPMTTTTMPALDPSTGIVWKE